MKKTLTVNLGGTVFNIDEDAYKLLDDYLNNLRLHFSKQDGAEEIITDIETRISELFSEERRKGAEVITLSHVQQLIERMGSPEELAGEDAAYDRQSSTSSEQKGGGAGGKRRLYRNPDDVMLGGVISGLAAYTGCDVTLLRLIMLVLLCVSVGTMIIIYLICWIIIPQAHTAAEKLSMRGEEINIGNIGKTVSDGFEKVSKGVNDYMYSDKPRSFIQKLADAIVAIIGFVLKACLIIVALAFSPVLFILAIVFVVLIIGVIVALVGGAAALFSLLPTLSWAPMVASPLVVIVSYIAGILIVGIPLAAIVFAILRLVFKWSPMVSGLKWTLVYLWIVGVIIFVITLAQMGWQFPLLTL